MQRTFIACALALAALACDQGAFRIRGDLSPVRIGETRVLDAVGGSATWSVNGIVGGDERVGTIREGRYSPPLHVPAENPVTIGATSVRDPAITLEAELVITPGTITNTPGVSLPTQWWWSYSPRVVSTDRTDPVVLVIFAEENVTHAEIRTFAGETIPFRSLGGRLFQVELTPAQVLGGYQEGELHNNYGFMDLYSDTEVLTVVAVVNVLDGTVPDVSASSLGDDAQIAPHVLNLRWDDFAVETMSQRAVDAAYDYLVDEFDFVAVVWPLIHPSHRNHVGVRNDTDGIGRPRFDRSAEWGGASQLQGRLEYPMDVGFDLAARTTTHEIGHRNMNFLRSPSVLANRGAHWPLGELAYGVMGFGLADGSGGDFPFALVPVSDDEYRIEGRDPASQCNWLELYMMGLASPDEVPPFRVLDDQSVYPEHGAIVKATTYRIEDIVAAQGPRVPAYGVAQARFRLATVVLSAGRLLDADELSFFDHMAARGAATTELPISEGRIRGTTLPFHLATRGRGTLETHLE